MVGSMTLNEWADFIGQWHRRIFPWAKLPHVMEKLQEEKKEANLAWAKADDAGVENELADCLVCVLAAMSREGINPEKAVAAKFAQVMIKYNQEQPEPCQNDLFKS